MARPREQHEEVCCEGTRSAAVLGGKCTSSLSFTVDHTPHSNIRDASLLTIDPTYSEKRVRGDATTPNYRVIEFGDAVVGCNS